MGSYTRSGQKIRGTLEKRRNRMGIVYAIPAILGFLLFNMAPMLICFGLSLTDYKVAGIKLNFIGFENYTSALTGQNIYFYDSVKATFIYVLLTVPSTLIFSFALAILLNQKIKFLSVFRTIFYIPNIVPLVATCVIWMWMFQPNMGIINTALQMFGIEGPKWLFDRNVVLISLALMNLWASGNLVVIFLAGLQDCPRQLYEAIEVDGGNVFHKFRYITLPFMTPTIFFNLVMQTISAFQVFSQIIIMTGGGPNNASLVMNYYIYREAFTLHNMGYASALSVMLFIAIFLLTTFYFATSNKWVFYPEGSKK